MSEQMPIGHYFFENWDGATVTVDQENYRMVVRKFVIALQRKGIDMRREWFQQDGATPHTATETIRMLKETFRNRIISRRTDVEWAPHSPDLNPLDFFLWGHVKNQVFSASPQTLVELKNEIK